MLLKMVDFLKKQDVYSVPMKGIVVANDDPKKLGRVKCTIQGMLENTDPEMLPWIMPMNATGFGGKPDGSGMTVPDLKSELIVEFPYKSAYFAFYTGYWQSGTTHQGLFTEDYPNSYGFRDTQSSYAKINRAKGYAQFRHFGGVQMDAERDGSASMQAPKLMKFVSEDGKTELVMDMVEGVMTLHPKSETKIQAPKCTVDVDEQEWKVGKHKATISGASETTVLGAVKDNCAGSRSRSTVGNVSEATAGTTVRTYAQIVEETYGMTKQEMFVLGNKIATLLLGNHEIAVTVGNIVHKTLAGNVEMGNPLASFLYSKTGQATYKSTLDTVVNAALNVKVSAGVNFNVDAKAMAVIKAAVQAEVKAALVKLGAGSSPVLTMATDPVVDLITGVPTMGVPTVLAG
jgi:hypothetical protein